MNVKVFIREGTKYDLQTIARKWQNQQNKTNQGTMLIKIKNNLSFYKPIKSSFEE